MCQTPASPFLSHILPNILYFNSFIAFILLNNLTIRLHINRGKLNTACHLNRLGNHSKPGVEGKAFWLKIYFTDVGRCYLFRCLIFRE